MKAWLAVATAAGVDDGGRPVAPVLGGRRRRPQLVDYLETARAAGVDRVWLVGPRPALVRRGGQASEWLTTTAPGWEAAEAGHYFDADRPIGRFVHVETGARVMIRRAWEWFGETLTVPHDARAAWLLVDTAFRGMFGARLFDSPNAAGRHALAVCWGRNGGPPEPIGGELEDLIRSTSTQHRIQPLARRGVGGALGWLPGFVYYDARLAYAARTRELGVGPVLRLGARLATDIAEADPYARARYLIRWVAPAGWRHVGVLLEKDRDGGWHDPGAGCAWVDAVELHVARRKGWHIQILEAVMLQQGRPLDVWTDRLLRLRDQLAAVPATTAPAQVRYAAGVAVRSMLLWTIGGLASRGAGRVHYAPTAGEAPAGVILEPYGDGYIWRSERQQTAPAYPELAAQIWARSRAAVLSSKQCGAQVGALELPPEALIGIHGDALYLSRDPRWPDDGRPGRLRRKGAITETVRAPRKTADVYRLARRAEQGGTQ